MRRLLLSCVTLLFTSLFVLGQNSLIEYSAAASETSSGILSAENGVSGAGVTRVGVSEAPGAFYASQGFDTTGFITDEYLEFSISGSGVLLTISEINVRLSRSVNGPTGVSLRYNVDNYVREFISTNEFTELNKAFDVSGLALESRDTLTFRLYGFKADSLDGTLSLASLAGNEPQSSAISIKGTIEQPNPVELSAFTAVSAQDGAYLEWIVASEINNDYFSVEVSRDAEKFEEVERLAGRGTAETEANYSYAYKAYTSGIYYFRLRQVDFDGTETLSQVVPLNVQGRKGFSVIGNATQSILSLEVEGARDFRIISLTGEVVQSTPSLSGLVDVDVSNLPSGMYLLTDGTTTTRFVR